MKSIHEKIADIDWQRVTEEINEKGYAIVSQFLQAQSCQELIGKYGDSNLYRKTITMERHQFGLGEYKYFKYPLPDLIQIVRREVYPKLVPIANAWMKMLNMERQFPDTFDELQRLCHDNNQTKPIPCWFFIHSYRNSSLVSNYNMHKLIRNYDNTNNARSSVS